MHCLAFLTVLPGLLASPPGGHEGYRTRSLSLGGPWEFAMGEGDERAETPEGQARLTWRPVTLPGPFVPGNDEAARNAAFIWARRAFDVTAQDARGLAVLRWNAIAFGAVAYLNGREVGRNEPIGPYQVVVPPGVVQPGTNQIVLKIAGTRGVRKAKSGFLLVPAGFWNTGGTPIVTDDVWIDFADRAYLKWADGFMPLVRSELADPGHAMRCWDETKACLSALLAAGRNEEILELLALDRQPHWSYRRWGVKALAAMGRKAEALRYAEESRGPKVSVGEIAAACEEILLSSGMAEDAYKRYALESNQRMTNVAAFCAIARKYPHKEPRDILRDLVDHSGEPGKWFAAAKSAGLLDEAIELANRSPCDPMTLARAARDSAETEPWFAVEAGVAAIRWLAAGYGYDIIGTDIVAACNHTLKAAENARCRDETVERLRLLLAHGSSIGHLVTRMLEDKLQPTPSP